MKKLIFFKILLFTILLSSSCKDGDNNLNPSLDLQEGEFIVKVNGNEIRSEAAFGIIINTSIVDRLTIGAAFTPVTSNSNNTEGVELNFGIAMGESLEEGNYSFQANCDIQTEGICGWIAYTILNTSSNTPVAYWSDSTNININLISLDYRSGGHVIGTFSGTALNLDGSGESVTLTDGAFNVKIQ